MVRGLTYRTTNGNFEAMNDSTTPCRELKTQIRMPSRAGTDHSEFLKGKGEPEINQIKILIEAHHWAKFLGCKPCLFVRNI